MRKNKTWEITLTNNSRLVANDPIDNAVVYTTDTEAYLNFRVIDSGFEFDSATIAMLNKDDGSIVERPMTKEDDTAVYEIESDIVSHFGLWQAQVLFKQGEEVFTSTPVTFVIERYMMAEQPPRLEDVTNWKDLYENATETIQELTRVNDELNNTKQNVEQAETQRATAESDRVSAEEQREIDHANRSAELASKADKVVIKNLIANGDFRDGLIGWSGVSSLSLSLEDSMLKATYTSEAQNVYVSAPTHTYVTGDVYYVRTTVIPQANINSVRHYYNGVYHEPYLSDAELNVETVFSNTFKGNSDGLTTNQIRLIEPYPSVGDSILIKNSMLMNLTKIFGAGNEPTKEEMDELIWSIGFIDGEYALNNKEMLIWILVLIRRNKNAIVALGGA